MPSPSIKRNGVAIKGNIETKSHGLNEVSRNVAIRNELDLYVNVVHCKSFPGIPARHSNVDIILIRQNTEGEYAMLEHESVPGIVESMKVVTTENAERVARYAFEYARQNGRKKFDVMNMTNLYGTIVSNVICGLIGGAGLLSGRNYGDHYAIFEPGTRNTGTAIAGKNIANPVAMINASIDMLNHLGHKEHARVIQEATYETIVDRAIRTP
ncbi:Isocitrate dehydrogenase subunit gamma, mitochondrial, partial [Eumeta japonica]